MSSAASLSSSGSKSIPTTSPVLSVTASGASADCFVWLLWCIERLRGVSELSAQKCTCDLPVYGQYKGFLKLGIKSTCLYCASTIETGMLYGGYEAETDRFFLLIHIIVHPSIFLLVCHTQLKSREHQQRPVLFLHPYQHTVCLEGIHFSLQSRDFMIAEAHGMAMRSKRCICSNCNTSAIVTVGIGACGKTVLCSSLWKDRAL